MKPESRVRDPNSFAKAGRIKKVSSTNFLVIREVGGVEKRVEGVSPERACIKLPKLV